MRTSYIPSATDSEDQSPALSVWVSAVALPVPVVSVASVASVKMATVSAAVSRATPALLNKAPAKSGIAKSLLDQSRQSFPSIQLPQELGLAYLESPREDYNRDKGGHEPFLLCGRGLQQADSQEPTYKLRNFYPGR